MKKPVMIQKIPKIWKAQLIAAYALGAFSVVGVLGGKINFDDLEVHDASITLAVAVAWLIVVHFVIWLHRR